MLVPVSDATYETVLFDIENHPLSSMKAIAVRTGITYRTVTFCVRHLISDGAVVRRRIGQMQGGHGTTYANMVNHNFRF